MEDNSIGSLVYGLHDISGHEQYADKIVEKGASALPELYRYLQIGYTYGHEDIRPKILGVIRRIADNLLPSCATEKDIEKALASLNSIKASMNALYPCSESLVLEDRVASIIMAHKSGSGANRTDDRTSEFIKKARIGGPGARNLPPQKKESVPIINGKMRGSA